ncbi:hypothetical protein [Actinomadura flavalba]|uniref:hypothetical protein n=1 Tax=Actinomadura flavalba TaxID=1120938 RepID=UPI00037EEE43|nr:hypothetical protein [Actinomadura flavalba]
MRIETFTGDHDLTAAYPGARLCGTAEGTTLYLAEAGGSPVLIAVAPPTVTVLTFDTEHDRARHLAAPGT